MKNYFSKLNSLTSSSKLPTPGSGFTLIEVMIAVGLFTVVMVVGIGAVLNVNTTYKKTQKMRTLIDNMGFIMEDMTRTIRTGSSYIGGHPQVDSSNGTIIGTVTSTTPTDFGSTQSFASAISLTSTIDDSVVYAIASVFSNTNGPYGTIFKSTDGGHTYMALSPKEVEIDMTKSGFVVVGADQNDLNNQPRVTIHLEGKIEYRDDVTPFTLQTTVVSRIPKTLTP